MSIFIINGVMLFLLMFFFVFFIIILCLPKNKKKINNYSKMPFLEEKNYKSTSGDNSE